MNRFQEEAEASGITPSLVLSVLALIVIITIGTFSFKDIEPGETAIRLNKITGSQEPINQAGLAMQFPFVHTIEILDSKPQTFTMKGDKNVDALHVRTLTVRASDGSNFHFPKFELVFQVKGDEAVATIRDAGLGNGYQNWMTHYARSVLREEFGRESTLDVSDPTTYAAATQRSKKRLNELLEPHGVKVVQLVTPRPRFNDAYEKAIEDRNGLGNELQVIESTLGQASTDRARQLSLVDQEKNKEIQEKRAQLETSLAQATAEQAQKKQKADTFRIAALGEGQAAFSAATQKALELGGELNARYASKKAEIQAFRTQPVERVMQKLGERLKGTTISIQPWANDPNPTRVNVSKIAASQQ